MSYLYNWIDPQTLYRVGMYHFDTGKEIFIEKLGRDLNRREAWMVLEGTIKDVKERKMADEALEMHYSVYDN